MYKNVNDYEQLYLVSENDDSANAMLFDKYKPIVISIAKKYYSYANERYELDDFIQEGYIGLSKAISSFNESCNVLFYTFAIVCIERQIKSYHRKNNSLKSHFFDTAYSLDAEYDACLLSDTIEDVHDSNNPFVNFNINSINTDLIIFKNNLDIRNSMIFELRYNGFKYKEISTLLDIPIGIVDNCIHFCKNKLKNSIVKDYL